MTGVFIILFTGILCLFFSRVLKPNLRPLALLIAHTAVVVAETSRKALADLTVATALSLVMYSCGFAWPLRSPGRPPLVLLAATEVLTAGIAIAAWGEHAWHVSAVETAWAVFGIYHLRHAFQVIDDLRERVRRSPGEMIEPE